MEYTFNEDNLHGLSKPIKYIITKNGCWECISHKGVKRNGNRIGIARYIYSLHFGDISNGLIIRHKCDNGHNFCINPEHLELGTQQDNMNDMKERGRSVKGRKQPVEHAKERVAKLKKLNEEQLLEIKNLIIKYNNQKLSPTKANKIIAQNFNVSEFTIGKIRNGISVYSEFLNGGINNW